MTEITQKYSLLTIGIGSAQNNWINIIKNKLKINLFYNNSHKNNYPTYL